MSVSQMARRDHPTAEELVAHAAAMIPVLRSREAATLKAGQVSAETIHELQEAGFFRVLQPKRYGGYEMSPLAYGRIARALAEGCMSTAWVYAVVAVHNWELALFDDRAAQEVWGSDTNVRLCSSYMPVGRVTRVEGGYRLSGRWGFSSGSGHCDWVILGANIPSETPDAPPEPRNFLLPRADYQVLDNWDVMGLQGTGSNDILVENAFVPEYRTVRDQDLFDMRCPGHAVNTAPLYKIPFAQIFNRTVSSTSLGTLKHALDAFIEATRGRRTTYTGERLARDTSVQFTISEVERILDEQVLVMERDLSELLDRAVANDWPLERRAALAAATTATVSRCVRGIDLLMEFSGAKALFRGNPIRQAFLDIHSARAHVANNPYPYGRNRGAMLLGIDNDNQDI